MKLVSVIIPTKNRVEKLTTTLDTILDQTYSNLEVVVCNDGSTDETQSFLENHSDERVRHVHHVSSRGVANARNSAIEAAKGHYVAVCDDDDLWLSTKVALQVEALENSDALWCYAPTQRVDESMTVLFTNYGPAEPIDDTIYGGNPIPGGCSSVLAYKELFVSQGMFDDQFSMFADWDLWTRFAQKGEPVSSGEIGVRYVVHDAQMTCDQSGSVAELAAYRAKYGVAFDGKGALAPVDRFIAMQIRRSGNVVGALNHMRASCSMRQPRNLKLAARLVAPNLVKKLRGK